MEPFLKDHRKLLERIARAEATKAPSDGFASGWVRLHHGAIDQDLGSLRAIASLADRLAEHGLISFSEDPSMHKRLVRMTEAGKGYLNEGGLPRVSLARTALDLSRMHPRVLEVAGSLAASGHYRQAVLDSFIALIVDVKKKSGLGVDGVPLMMQAFSEKNPILKFATKDEQIGAVGWATPAYLHHPFRDHRSLSVCKAGARRPCFRMRGLLDQRPAGVLWRWMFDAYQPRNQVRTSLLSDPNPAGISLLLTETSFASRLASLAFVPLQLCHSSSTRFRPQPGWPKTPDPGTKRRFGPDRGTAGRARTE